MTLFIKNFFCKCNQIHKKLPIWLQFLKKFLMENFIFLQCLLTFFGQSQNENVYCRLNFLS